MTRHHDRPASRRRVEPWLDPSARGADGDSFRPPPAPTPPVRTAAWRRWLAVLLAIAVVAALLWWHRPISDRLWPDTRIQQLRSDAARALEAGELSRADGQGARELYEAALALDPDRDGARDGLVRVGEAALARAREQLDAGRLEDARSSLQLARELAMPRASTEALAERLHERESGAAGVEQWLADARTARAQGRLDGGEDSALPLYQRVLSQQPNQVEALEGREDTLSDLLQLARQSMTANDLPAAAERLERARSVDPGHIDLPRTVALLGEQIEQRLRDADLALQRGRLPRALAAYDEVLLVQPGSAAAEQGRLRVANAHAALSRRHAADFQIRQAGQELAEAQAIAPDAPAVLAARQHLAEARLLQARLHNDLPPARKRQRVQDLVDAAGAAEARGDLLLPPGDSAYDKLRTAHSIAPDDPAVIAMVRRLRPAARDCFETALRGNRLTTAGGCLDAYAVLEGDAATVRAARSQLALRWIAVGGERLGAGELQAARHALETARALDPSTDGLQALAQRVEAASVPAVE